MAIFKKRELITLAQYIFTNFDIDRIQFQSYLFENIPQLSKAIDSVLDEDDFWGTLENSSSHILRYLEELIKREKGQGHPIKCEIEINYCLEFLVRTTFGYKSDISITNWMNDCLSKVSLKDEMTKARYYEDFCVAFLKDMGIQCFGTKYTGDSGIDLVGVISLNSEPTNPIDFILYQGKFILLGQVKCTENFVDTPVLRHLIGDSIFNRFYPKQINCPLGAIVISNHPNILCVFSHSGFTKEAYSFAKNHGIRTFSSQQMVNLLSGMKDIKNLETYKHLSALNL